MACLSVRPPPPALKLFLEQATLTLFLCEVMFITNKIKMISITRLMQVQNKNGFKIQFTTRKLCFGKTVCPLRHRLPTSNRPSGLRLLQSLHSKVDPELVLACGTAL